MALIDEDALSKLCKNPGEEHIFLLFGDDSYLKEVYGERLQKAVLPEKSLQFFNFHAYEDADTPLEEIFDDADILPVMAERTCLLVKNYPLHTLSEKALKDFETNLAAVPQSCVIIFYYPTLEFTYNRREYAKWCAVIDIFKKLGVAAELSHRTGKKVIRLLLKGAADRGAAITENEAAYLIQVCGEDLGNLLNEFNKLCAYADGQPITTAMIDEIVTKSVEASVFDISAMIFSGNADKAFAIVYELLRQKTPVQSIMGALNQSYMTIYRYKVTKNAGRSLSELTEAMEYKGDQSYIFQKISAFANKSDMKKIRRSLDILTEVDIKSKSMSINPETLLTQVIASLCAVV